MTFEEKKDMTQTGELLKVWQDQEDSAVPAMPRRNPHILPPDEQLPGADLSFGVIADAREADLRQLTPGQTVAREAIMDAFWKGNLEALQAMAQGQTPEGVDPTDAAAIAYLQQTAAARAGLLRNQMYPPASLAPGRHAAAEEQATGSSPSRAASFRWSPIPRMSLRKKEEPTQDAPAPVTFTFPEVEPTLVQRNVGILISSAAWLGNLAFLRLMGNFDFWLDHQIEALPDEVLELMSQDARDRRDYDNHQPFVDYVVGAARAALDRLAEEGRYKPAHMLEEEEPAPDTVPAVAGRISVQEAQEARSKAEPQEKVAKLRALREIINANRRVYPIADTDR